MSKKKQPKQLSPENYIKIKARTLPIDACYINNDWIDSKMANIIILRKHTTGKFTFGIYLVDLLALGTKDTFFNFSQPIQIVDDILSRANFIQIEYNLAHNIIYGGNEFAEEHGFKIHKAFNSVTKYILEPDDDNIPLIEVEFGKDGKPLVII